MRGEGRAVALDRAPILDIAPAFVHLEEGGAHLLGLGDLADRLKLLSRAQRWEEMPQHIDDEVLNTFVTIGTYDTIAKKLTERFGNCVTDCEFSIAVKTEADKERLRALAREIQGRGTAQAQKTIVG